MDISQHYTGARGRDYLQLFDGIERSRAYQTHYFRPYCREDLTLLDFGCADGLFLRILPARRRIGIEANPAARDRCTGLDELHQTLETVDSASVDVVISNHCLEHVLHPLEALRDITRVLKPGGVCLIVVPFDDWRSTRHRLWSPHDPDNHLYTWSPLNLGNLVTEAGMHVEFCRARTTACHPKLLWTRRLGLLELACQVLGYVKNKHEVFCKAVK